MHLCFNKKNTVIRIFLHIICFSLNWLNGQLCEKLNMPLNSNMNDIYQNAMTNDSINVRNNVLTEVLNTNSNIDEIYCFDKEQYYIKCSDLYITKYVH